jgi:repressor LexA
MRTADLTEKQYRVLAYLFERTWIRGRSPTVRELSQHFGFASPRAGAGHIEALERKGYVRRAPYQRGVELIYDKVWELFGIPVLGRVAAGLPLFAEENFERVLTPNDVFPRSKGIFALRVKGESMKEAGILEGDIAIVRSQATAQPGQLVVAQKDNEATLKRYVRVGVREYLEPANPDYKRTALDGWQIVGVVIQVVRQYAKA